MPLPQCQGRELGAVKENFYIVVADTLYKRLFNKFKQGHDNVNLEMGKMVLATREKDGKVYGEGQGEIWLELIPVSQMSAVKKDDRRVAFVML